MAEPGTAQTSKGRRPLRCSNRQTVARGSFALLVVAGFGDSSSAWAQRPDHPAAPDVSEAPNAPQGRGLPTFDTACDDATILGGTDNEKAAACAVWAQKFVSARTLADRALRANERSFRAHYLMGAAQHMGEGNLPKALFHLETAERLFIEAHGLRPERETSPWPVYHRTLRELVWVHGEMDLHEQKIRYVDALKERLDLDYEPLKAWPLMKLKRFNEARAIAKRAIEKDDRWYQAVGLTALCAVESEQKKRYEAYEACRAAAKPVLRKGLDGAIELSNAAAAAEEVFRFDEAERLYLESARRVPEGSVNPWGRLVRLYVRQGRFAEALSAWREMRAYRGRRPGSYLDQQDQSEADLLGVEVMLMAGRAEEAERVTRRTVQRPDRQGTSSADAAQNEAGAAIIDRVAKLSAARALEEEASISTWWTGIRLRLRAWSLRFDAWMIGRRAAELLSDPERMKASLRPECPGSVEGPAWLDVEIVDLVGPGVALAALDQARVIERLPTEQAEMVFGVHEAEAHWRASDTESALRVAKETLALLPIFEVMLRARVAAIGADSARREGDYEEAQRLFRQVMDSDPGVLRRLGLQLPVRFSRVGDDPSVVRAVAMLSSSPRLREVEWGFELRVSDREITLLEDDGSQLVSARVPPGRNDSVEAAARRIARVVHRGLLVPDVDLTQADIRSLDGGLGTGGKASERVKGLLDELLDQPK